MIDPDALREFVRSIEIPDPYRQRVESYGPDAARTLLRLYDILRGMVDDSV